MQIENWRLNGALLVKDVAHALVRAVSTLMSTRFYALKDPA
jgi:hypothetical protein